MIKLKPCPFCGNKSPIMDNISHLQAYYCMCKLCHATGPVCSCPEIAADTWNHADKRKEKENVRYI